LGVLDLGDLIFGTLLILIALAAVALGSIDSSWEWIFESAIFLLGAFAIVTGSVGKRWRGLYLLAPVTGVVLIACLQTIPLWSTSINPNMVPGTPQTVSLDPSETQRFIIKFLAVAIALGLLLRYTSNRKRLLALAHLVIIVGAASVGIAILRQLLPNTAFASLWSTSLHGSSFGQFINRNHFALLMEMSLGPAMSLGFYAWSGAKRLFYFEIALLICLELVLTNSRGGFISLIGQLAFLSWIYFGELFGSLSRRLSSIQTAVLQRFWLASRTPIMRCALIVFALGVISAGVLWLGGERVRQRLESVPAEFLARTDGLQHQNPRRLEIWTATLKLIEAHPLLGSGLGAYQTAATQYLRSEGNWQPQQAHNEYLELLAGEGIVGAAMGVWFVFILIRESRKRLLVEDRLRRVLCKGALVGLVGVAIHSLVDFGLHVLANALICCCLIALATAKIHSVPIKSHSPVH